MYEFIKFNKLITTVSLNLFPKNSLMLNFLLFDDSTV